MRRIVSVEDLSVGDIFIDSDEDYCRITDIDSEYDVSFVYADTLEMVEEETDSLESDCYDRDHVNNMITSGRFTFIKLKEKSINWKRRIGNEKTKEGESTNHEA